MAKTLLEGTRQLYPALPWPQLSETFEKYIRLVRPNAEEGLDLVEVGPWVGSLPLPDGQVLSIHPRIGAGSFWRLFAAANDLPERLELPEFAKVHSTKDGHSPWSRLLESQFSRQLRIIDAKGLPREMVSTVSIGSFGSGRIFADLTARRLALRMRHPVVRDHRRATDAVPEESLLSAAAALLLASRSGVVPTPEEEQLRKWAHRAARKRWTGDVEIVARRLGRGDYAGRRGYMREALAMALAIVARHGISLVGDPLPAKTTLLYMPLLAEKWVSLHLRRELFEFGLTVSKPPRAPVKILVDVGPRLVPDLCIYERDSVVAVLDVKYKPNLSITQPADLYQVFSYARILEAREAVIVAFDSSASGGSISEVSFADGLPLTIARVGGDNLDAATIILRELAWRLSHRPAVGPSRAGVA